MKQFSYLWLCLILAMTLTSCELVGDVLEMGVWLGLFVAALVIGLIIWIARKFRR
jgi:hypothetical protein